ncbi:hypothetical protein ACVH9Z_28865 [Rhodococcus opacus]|nr:MULTISPECIES: hypothetical protein [Rhodococcus]
MRAVLISVALLRAVDPHRDLVDDSVPLAAGWPAQHHGATGADFGN